MKIRHPADRPFLTTRWLASLSLLTLLFALSPGAQAQYLLNSAANTTIKNFTFSQPTGWASPGNPPSGGSASTTITISESGTQFVTNDYAGNFQLNLLQKNTGIWTVYAMNGGVLEFVANGGTAPEIFGNQAGIANLFTITAPMQLDNDTIVTNVSAGTITISGLISGAAGLIFNGTNTLTLAGSVGNTYGGTTTVNGGKLLLNNSAGNAIPGNVTIGGGTAQAVLQMSSANQIADTSILTFGANGIFRLNGQFDTIGGLASASGNGLIENSNATSRTLTLNLTADQTFSGVIQNGAGAGNLAITKTGPNAQILTGVNTYTGGTIVSAGALTLSGSGSINNSTSVSVASNATFNVLSSGFTVSSGHTLTGAGTVGGGTVTVASGGTLNPGDNATAGNMTVTALTLSSGATNTYYFETGTPTNDLVIANNSGGLTLNGGSFNLFLTNSSIPFTKLGTYNLIQYSGSIGGTGLDSTWTTVSASNPHIANPQSGLVYSFVASGGYLQVTIGASAFTAFWNVDANGSWNLASDWNPATIPNAAGAIASFGGTTAFRAVTLDANQTVGTLAFSSVNSFEVDPNGAFSITLNNSTKPAQINAYAGTSNNVTAPVALTAGVTVSAFASTAVALNGNISGIGGLTNSGLGTLTLGGANTYTVGTVQNSGTLVLNSAGALGTVPLTINGGTLDNTSGTNVTLSGNSAQTWNAGYFFAGTTNLNLGSGAVNMALTTMTINVISNTLTVGGALSGTNLTKNGNGTLTLGGANKYIGTTTINAGTANLTGVSTITNVITINSGGTLVLNAAGGALPGSSKIIVTGTNSLLNVAQADTIATLTFGTADSEYVIGSGVLTVTNAVTANIAISNTVNLSVPVAGAASLTKTGQGTMLLGAVNSYTGGTLVDGANSYLKVTNSGTLGSTSGTLNVDTASAIVDLGGSSQTVGPVLIGGIITNGTLTGTSYTVTNGAVYANLAGSGAILTKSGPNTAILAGANTYTGATTISAGTLQVDGSIASGSTVTVTNTGTLSGNGTIGGSVTVASGAVISGGDNNNVGTLAVNGNLQLNGGNLLSFAGTNTSTYSRITVLGNLNPSGVTIILPPAAPLPNGNYNLISVSGTLGGGATNFTITSVSPRTYNIVYQPGSPNKVVLQVTTPVLLTWLGDGSANNWNLTDGGDWGNPPPTLATYADGDSALFDDTAAPANTTVSVQGTLSPLAVTVNCNTNAYIFNDGGSGNISGAATLTKQGTNTLTINTANTYTGVTTVSGGTLVINADNALGTSPATPTPGQLVLNGGTLASSGLSLDPNRSIALGPSVGSGSAVIDTIGGGTITIPGMIANNLTGKGALIAGVSGAGTIILSGTNTYTGGSSITNGILELQNNQSAANGGFYVGLHNDYTCYLQIDAGANVVVSSANAIQVGPNNTATIGITGTSGLLDSGTVTNYGSFLAGRVSAVTIEPGGLWVQNGLMTVEAYGNLAANMTVAAGGTNIYTGTNAIQLNGPGTTYPVVGKLTINGTFVTGQGFTNAINTQTTGNGYGQVTLGGGGLLQLTASIPNLFAPTTNTYGGVHCVLNGGVAPTIDTQGFIATNYANITGNGGLTKLGIGLLVMAGTNSYVGNTTVNGGVLAIQQPTLAANSSITVTNGAVLELDFVGGATNTVQSLVVNGVALIPGVYGHGVGPTNLTGPGSLQVTGTPATTDAYLLAIVLTPAGNLSPAFNPYSTFTYTAINQPGDEPTVTVTNSNPSATDELFTNGVDAGPLTSGVPSAPLTLGGVGSTNLVQVLVTAVDGVTTNLYTVNVKVGSSVATNPTNITYSVSGGYLNMSWPADHLGWQLYTNAVSLTAMNSWFPIPGSGSVTNQSVTINPAIPHVFYQLRYP